MKKLSAVLLTLTMLLAASCAQKATVPEEEILSQSISVIQTSYKETSISIGDIYDESVSLQRSGDGYCFFYESGNKLKMVRIDSELKVSEPVELEDAIGSGGSGIAVHDDGSFTVLSPGTDFEFEYDEYGIIQNYGEFLLNGSLYFTLNEYDSSGKMISQTDVPELKNIYDVHHNMISGMISLGDGKYAVSLNGSAAIIDESGAVIDSRVNDQNTIYFGTDCDGRLMVSTSSNFSYADENDILKMPPDTENRAEFSNSYYEDAKPGDMGFKAFIAKEDGIYGYTEEDGIVLVIDYKASMIGRSDISDFACCGDGQFLACGYTDNSLKLYTRRPDDYTDDRQTVNVWQIDGGTDDSDAVRFNKQNDDYLIRYESTIKHLSELTQAVLAGESPDLIYYSNRSILDGMINLGAAADIYPLMESYDGVKADELMPNVMEAFDMDGKLYAIPENFCVKSCFANSSFIGDEYRDWTFEDMFELYNNRPEGMSLTTESVNDDAGYLLVVRYPDPWIDIENKTCSFDSQEFVELLNFCKSINDTAADDITSSDEDQWKEKMDCMSEKKAMLNMDSGARYGLNMVASALGRTGLTMDEASILNMPDSGGVGTIVCDNCWTVLNTGSCQEGAWAFVSYLLSEEKQMETAQNVGGWNWTNKKAFELGLEKTITPDGETKTEKMQYTVDDEVCMYEYPVTVTKEQADRYRDFVMNCTRLEYENDEVSVIVMEEYERFANGEVTAEECAAFIQDRVSILLAEKY